MLLIFYARREYDHEYMHPRGKQHSYCFNDKNLLINYAAAKALGDGPLKHNMLVGCGKLQGKNAK